LWGEGYRREASSKANEKNFVQIDLLAPDPTSLSPLKRMGEFEHELDGVMGIVDRNRLKKPRK
jgi:hypothetical protein